MMLLDPFQSLRQIISFESVISAQDSQIQKEIRYLENKRTKEIEMRTY